MRFGLANEEKDIPALIAAGNYKAVVSNLLDAKGLNYGQLPKGLLLFHRQVKRSVLPWKNIWLKVPCMPRTMPVK